jgi:putative oxidoreductase
MQDQSLPGALGPREGSAYQQRSHLVTIETGNTPMNKTLINLFSLSSRLFLAQLFIGAGMGKLNAIEGTVGYMTSADVPMAGLLVYLVLLTELGGGLLIAIGYQTRIIAFLLAGFTILSALIFHFNFGDQNQMIHFLKNIAIAGGFFSLVANGAGSWSVDGRK